LPVPGPNASASLSQGAVNGFGNLGILQQGTVPLRSQSPGFGTSGKISRLASH
jgi:hypothetical protein